MGEWKKIKIGEFLNLYRNEHMIEDNKIYKQVTISKDHGISLRGSKLGKNIGRKRQFVVDLQTYPNTVLFTRQGVRDGAIGIAPIEVDQCIVTENMPMMSIDTDIVEKVYLKKMLVSEYLYEKIRLLTVVGSAQKSIHERDLLNIEIELPDLIIQQRECKKFDVLDVDHTDLKQEITHQQTLLKKLRQQILQEAIEGKLTKDWREQNPDVEPAGDLLNRIQAEKEQLIKDKKIKKQKVLPPISEKEKPFDLPEGWVWCRLGESGLFERGKSRHRPRNDETLFSKGKYPFVQTGDVAQSKKYNFKINTFSKMYNSFGLLQSRLWKKGTLCITIAANIAETGFLDIDACFPDSVVGFLSLLDIEMAAYVKYYIDATRDDIEEFAPATAQKNINLGIINMLSFPLPPFSEQKAIVAKVKKLLVLCDQLETQITQNQNHAEQLMQSVLKEAFSQGK